MNVVVDKGWLNGTCNRSACDAKPATWWNPNTRANYCAECARRINEHVPESQAQLRCVPDPRLYDKLLADVREAAATGRIEFAAELEESDFRPGLLRTFLEKVCNVDLDRAYVSTETDLSDFGDRAGATREERLAKIRAIYGRDLSHIPGGIRLRDALRALETQ